MADLILSEDFKRNRDARLKSPDGRKALDEFADLIMDWALDVMPPDIREVLLTPEGIPELMKLWPQIVNGYFLALSGPSPRQKRPKPIRNDKLVTTAAELGTETQKRAALRREW